MNKTNKATFQLLTKDNKPIDHPILKVDFIGDCYFPITGELVFTTGMTGYIETITDPSYQAQIVVFSNPLIGNVACTGKFQSLNLVPESIIVQEFDVNDAGNIKLLEAFKLNKKVIVIHPDTRALIKLIRDNGSLKCQIIPNDYNGCYRSLESWNYEDESVFNENQGYGRSLIDRIRDSSKKEKDIKRCCVIDCGYKFGIINALKDVGFSIDIFDHKVCNNIILEGMTDLSYQEKLNNYYDAFVITNGPGNPKKYTEVIEFIKKLIKYNKKFLGICLGHQLVALAYGLGVYKMKYGHRSNNQPVQDLQKLDEAKYYITSQNHGYCVNASFKSFEIMNRLGIDERFMNMNDGTNEGLCGPNFITTQFHPEGQSGPNDTNFIFKEFYDMVNNVPNR